MPASQDWRVFFQGSPIAFIYKIPLLLIVGLVFAVYSGIKALILRLPNLFLSLLHYADVCYDRIVQLLVRQSTRFYEQFLRHIPFYMTNHILPPMYDAMLFLLDSATRWGRLCYRSVIKLIVAVERHCHWFWLHCLEPLYLFIQDHVLPWLARNLLSFLRTMRWYLNQTIHYIDIFLRFLLRRVLSPVYRVSRTVIVYLGRGIYRWTQTILYYLVNYLFLIIVHLALHVIAAYDAVKFLYSQYLLPRLTRFPALFWLIGEHIWTMVSSLANALQRFGHFFSNSVRPALAQTLSTSSSLMLNLWMNTKTSVSDAVQVASQLINDIHRHFSNQ